MGAYADALRAEGRLVAVDSLASTAQATRVQRRPGSAAPLLRDGPFTEAKEMIGGYFVVDCADFDAAVALAARCPAADWATVEVRAFGPCHAESSADPGLRETTDAAGVEIAAPAAS